MMVFFGNVSKRGNSTYVPSLTIELEVSLKDRSNILSPFLMLQSYPNPSSFNYCEIPDFGRFYYISNWVYYRGVWECECQEDYLASWKTNILSQSAFVLFSSSQYNLQALDSRIASTASYDRQVNTEAFVGTLSNQQTGPDGYFALTVLANNSVWATGAATTFFLTYQQMQIFARELVDADVWESLLQFFSNPVNAIVDCYYMPIDVTQYVDLATPQTVTIGDYSFSAEGRPPLATNLAIKSKHVEIEIPWKYSDFRRLSPYSEVSLFVPFCGSKTLPTEMLSDIEKVLIDYSVDVSTGAVQALAYVKQEVIAEFSGNLRVMLPIGQTQARVDSILGGAAGLVTAIGGAASGDYTAFGKGVISAVSSIVSPATHHVCGGMNGSMLGAILGNDVMRWQRFHLSCTSRDTTDTPVNMRPVLGNALYKAVPLSTLTGYCRTQDFSLSAQCLYEERVAVNNLMDGGVYIE